MGTEAISTVLEQEPRRDAVAVATVLETRSRVVLAALDVLEAQTAGLGSRGLWLPLSRAIASAIWRKPAEAGLLCVAAIHFTASA